MYTLLVPYIWFSRRTSIHVRSVIKDWFILPVNKTEMTNATGYNCVNTVRKG